jgi:hypothetical protein
MLPTEFFISSDEERYMERGRQHLTQGESSIIHRNNTTQHNMEGICHEHVVIIQLATTGTDLVEGEGLQPAVSLGVFVDGGG